MMARKPPADLHHGPVRLDFERTVRPPSGGELVPYYHFKITDHSADIVGHINFRVGDTRHIRLCAGHIGYGVLPSQRGHSYSYHACLALAPFVRLYYKAVIITADADNIASLRTIEKLGAEFIEEIDVPPDDPIYADNIQPKRRYQWRP